MEKFPQMEKICMCSAPCVYYSYQKYLIFPLKLLIINIGFLKIADSYALSPCSSKETF